jgi:hypothetical protein
MTNNATSLLSSPLGNNPTTDLTVSITAGDEGKFPTLGLGDWHPVTVTKSTGEREVMRCTARSGVNLTVVRAQEGTSILSFVAGDARVDVRLTGAALDEIAIHDKIYSVPADIGIGFRTTPSRFVWNDKYDLSGTDIMSLNDTGGLTANGNIASAAGYFVGTGTTVGLAPTTAGTISLQPGGVGVAGGQLTLNSTGATFAGTLAATGMLYANGGLTVAGALDFADVSVDTLTISNAASGYGQLFLTKTAGAHSNQLIARNGSEYRWIMQLGDTVAESGTGYIGSNFNLIRYNNAGAAGDTVFQVIRDTGNAYIYHSLYVTLDCVANTFKGNDNVTILGTTTNGTIYFRPNGSGSSANQSTIDLNGNMVIGGALTATGAITANAANSGEVLAGQGLRCKLKASSTSYTTSHANFSYDGLPCITIDETLFRITGVVVCDYRIKQDVKPLDSTWERIKAFKPISYKHRDYEIIKADGLERYGFIAHELAETLPTMAAGEKDGEHLQSVDLLPVVAMLTKALQEAQLRIEALEKRLA